MWQNGIIFTPTVTDALMVLFFHGPETQKKVPIAVLFAY